MRTRNRVRGIVLTRDGAVVLIRRQKSGREPYWVLPGGGVEETDHSFEAALNRELSEELGAHVTIRKLVHIVSDGETDVQYLFLCDLDELDPNKRHGPEFQDPTRGEYGVALTPCLSGVLGPLNIQPPEAKTFLLEHISALQSLPDLRR